MHFELPKYPLSQEFILKLSDAKDTFLYDRVNNQKYGFWPHFEHFLANLTSYTNYDSIIRRLSLTAPCDLEISKAWGKWQRFRSAQSEVTSIFIIEKFFSGAVKEIIAKKEKVKTPDLKVSLNLIEILIEVKAQSGQQHGTKHPRCEGSDFYSPQDEADLNSWLFQEKISSRNGKPMKPKAIEAEEKGAAVLFAMTDIMLTVSDIEERTHLICPGCKFIRKRCFSSDSNDSVAVYFFHAKFPILNRPSSNLKEIWLFDECHLDEFVVLSECQSLLLE